MYLNIILNNKNKLAQTSRNVRNVILSCEYTGFIIGIFASRLFPLACRSSYNRSSISFFSVCIPARTIVAKPLEMFNVRFRNG